MSTSPGSLRRWAAALSLVAVFGGGGWGASAFVRHQKALREGPATPFHPDSLMGVGPDHRPSAVPSGRQVVLYVSGHCPYCRAELRAWARLLESGSGRRSPWVVVAPDTEAGEARTLLRSFHGRWMMDPTGAVGRSLQVRAVPFIALLDSAGDVVEAHAGLSSPEARVRLATLPG